MPFDSSVSRKPVHTRKIEMNSFLREDGLWELEATLLDVKAYDFPKRNGSIKVAGSPVHNMTICLLVSEDGEVRDARAHYDDAPYEQNCSAIEKAYKGLIGLHLLRNFRNAVKERFSRTSGCTHMSELVVLLPTVFVQSLSVSRNRKEAQSGKKPFQLEGCHALALTSPVVKEFYPEWYVNENRETGKIN
ncbi:DUF2889 domain-containing protein [Advenella alkanexedens]|uniref:DUF2889 domain-containing protein n=1 Tax=Advenella alkanexedens TaxID=1481665 RepID=UPI00267509A2|nr:DUF2889 domain-containing protein [Advenella alkanexedens]WKU18534.1 DUF2889 domain-containing protein [Advenella alkanexedens]